MKKATSTPSRSVSSAALLGVSLAVSLLSASTAVADTKKECSDAYDKVQNLRDEGKVEDALKLADVCSRDSCAKFIRDDCAKWKADMQAREASVVIDVRDASGSAITRATVTLDGAPWLDHLDAAAHVVAKGAHKLTVTTAGAPPHEESINIQEGEKNRKLTITLGAKAAPEKTPEQTPEKWPETAPPPSADSAPVEEKHSLPAGAFVLGGIGVAALIGGAVTGGLTLNAYQTMNAQCGAQYCTQAGSDAVHLGEKLGPATTGLLAGGGALVLGGIIWLAAAPHGSKAHATSLIVAPVVTREATGATLAGRF